MSAVTLTNDFHYTQVTLRLELGRPLSSHQIRRSRESLCGVDDCTCGGDLGQRGWQGLQVIHAGHRKDGSEDIRIYNYPDSYWE